MNPYIEKMLTKEEIAEYRRRELKDISTLEEPVVKTKIPVTEAHLLRVFLDANDMSSFVIGYYTDYTDHTFNHVKGYGMNNLCYSTKGANFLIESNIMYMKIKYKSLEEAFNLFKKEYYSRV